METLRILSLKASNALFIFPETKLRGGGDDVMFSKELVARNSAKDNDGCEWKMVHFIPLSCHQGKVIEVAGELFTEGCARGETPAKNLIKISFNEDSRLFGGRQP